MSFGETGDYSGVQMTFYYKNLPLSFTYFVNTILPTLFIYWTGQKVHLGFLEDGMEKPK